MIKNLILPLLIFIFSFSIGVGFVEAGISCGWSCNGPGSWSCKDDAGTTETRDTTCSDGSPGTCTDTCVGSTNGTQNCGGVSVNVSCSSATKSSTGCCGGTTTTTSNPPEGFLDIASCTNLKLSTVGWAKDRDVSDKVKVDIYLDGTDSSNVVATLTADQFRQSLHDGGYGDVQFSGNNLKTLSVGTHKLYAKAKDANGNKDNWLFCGANNPNCKGGTDQGGYVVGGYLEFKCDSPLDTEAPACGDITVTPASPVSTKNVTITATATDNVGITFGGLYVLKPDGVTNVELYRNDNPSSGSLSKDWEIPNYDDAAVDVDGKYRIQANWYDAAGNFKQCPYDFIVDKTPPVCGSITFTPDADNSKKIVIKGTASDTGSGLVRAGIYGKSPGSNSSDIELVQNNHVFSPSKNGEVSKEWDTTSLAYGTYAFATNWWDATNNGKPATYAGGHPGNFVQCTSEYTLAPPIPDCTGLGIQDADFNTLSTNELTVGENYYAMVTADPGLYTTAVDTVGISILDSALSLVPNSYNPLVNDSNKQICATKEIGYYTSRFPSVITKPASRLVGPFKFDTPGVYSIFGRVWNGNITECKSACVDGPPRYLCKSGPALCKSEVTVLDSPQVDLTCGPSITSNPSGAVLAPGGTAALELQVSNFTNSSGFYNWSATKGSVSTVLDTNCSRRGATCNLGTGNRVVTGATYTAPVRGVVGVVLDTVTFNATVGSKTVSCTKQFSVCNPIDLDLTFDKTEVKFVKGETFEITPTIQINSYNPRFNAYPDFGYNINLTCPAGVGCVFADTGLGTRVLNFNSSNGSYAHSFSPKILVTSPIASVGTLLLTGSTIDNGVCLATPTKNISVPLEASGTYDLDIAVKKVEINSPADVLTDKSDYCSLPSSGLFSFNDPINYLVLKYSLTGNLIGELPGINALPYGFDYNFSANLTSSQINNGLEVKCIRFNNANHSGNSVVIENSSLNPSDTKLDLLVVVGKTIPGAWFQALGGSVFALNNINSEVPENKGKLLDSYSNIAAGILTSGNRVLKPTDSDRRSNFLIEQYPNRSKPLIRDIGDKFEPSFSPISSINSVDFDLNKTKFYFKNGDLDVDTETEYKAVGPVPVVFVKGDVYIAGDVTRLDAYIIATGKITIKSHYQAPTTDEISILVNGGLVGSKIELEKKPPIVGAPNNDPVEKFQYSPSAFFAARSDLISFPASEVRIYVKTID